MQGIVTQEDVRKFAEGVDIHEKKLTAPAVLEVVKSGEVSEILLTICEGKFHQVKRMFEAVGKKVIYLKRLSMGPLQLDETLMPGEYRELTEKEKDTLCSVEKKAVIFDMDGTRRIPVDLAGSGPDLFKEIPSDPAARIARH
mgnify:CR=1 FL=1